MLPLSNMSSAHSGHATDLKSIALRTINPQDCHTFIVQLTDYAIDCDKQSDDEWIAEMAALRMSHDALEWDTDQDVETQESWKQLRKALLKEAKLHSGGSSFTNSLAAPPGAALIPTPAAAPEGASSTASTSRVGRIRVEAAGSQFSGYVSSTLSLSGGIRVITEAHNALTVQYNPIDDFPVLNVTNPNHKNAALGIHWMSDPKQGDNHFRAGILVIVSRSPPTASSWTTGEGPWDLTSFMTLPNSSLLTFSAVSPERYLLDMYLHKSTGALQFCVSYDELVVKLGAESYHCRVSLKIESL